MISVSWIVVFIYFCMTKEIFKDIMSYKKIYDAKLLREGVKVFTGLLTTALGVRLHVIMAGLLSGQSSVALVDMSNRFGSLVNLVNGSVASTFSQKYAVLYDSKKFSELRRALLFSSLIAAVPALLWLILIYYYGDSVVGYVLPGDYSGLVDLMFVVALGYFVNACFGQATTLLIMANKPDIVLNASLMGLFVAFVSTFYLYGSLNTIGLVYGFVIFVLIKDVCSMLAFVYLSNDLK
jgi:O-antigen/teichoic acid export membrane protein